MIEITSGADGRATEVIFGGTDISNITRHVEVIFNYLEPTKVRLELIHIPVRIRCGQTEDLIINTSHPLDV